MLISILSNSGVAVSRLWAQLAGLAMMLTAAKLLTPTDFGVFALATAATMILNQLVGVGPYEYIIRERKCPEVAHTAFWFNMAGAAVMSGVGLVTAFAIGGLSHTQHLATMVAVLSLLTLPAGWRSVIEATLVRDGRLAAMALGSIAVETIALAAGLWGLLSGLGIYALLLHKVVQFVSAVPVLSLIARWRPRIRFEPRTARSMASFGSGIFGDRVLAFLQAYGVDLILGALFNPAAVAIYRVGARIVIAISSVITEQLRTLAWVRLSRVQAAGQSVPAEAERIIGSALVIIAGPFVGLALTSDLLIQATVGPNWAMSAQVVSLLSIAGLISIPQLFSDAILGAQGNTRWLLAMRLATVAMLMVCLLLTARWGPVWTAAGQVVASVVGGAVIVVLQARIAGVRIQGYLPTALRSAIAVAAMAAAVLATKAALVGHGLHPALTLAATAAIGGLVYVVASWLVFGREAKPIVSAMLVREPHGVGV